MTRIGSLFSGAGGLDMAVEAAFGGHTVWQSELNEAASTVLAARWPGVSNLGDITAVDWSTAEPVDVLCGGFPCQDVSSAGKRAGIRDGTRSGLWSIFADAIDALRPPVVVIENVRGLLSATAHRPMEPDADALGDGHPQPVLRAIGAVLGDLSDLGYDAQWATVSAASIGAPHRRERVFILATDTTGHGRPRVDGGARSTATRSGRERQPAGSDGSATTPDTASDGRHEGGTEPTRIIGRSDAAVGSDADVDLLPTPAASRSGRNQSPSAGAAIRPSLDMIGDLLPTPSAADGNGGHLSRSGDRGGELLLPGVARAYGNGALLPTPAAADGQRGQDYARAGRDGSGGDDLVTAAVKAHNESAWGKYAAAIERWEALTRPAPDPTEPNSKGNHRLSSAFAEWLMGWPAGHVTDVPGVGRNDQLRIIGNGVVPQQAFAAIRSLLDVAFLHCPSIPLELALIDKVSDEPVALVEVEGWPDYRANEPAC